MLQPVISALPADYSWADDLPGDLRAYYLARQSRQAYADWARDTIWEYGDSGHIAASKQWTGPLGKGARLAMLYDLQDWALHGASLKTTTWEPDPGVDVPKFIGLVAQTDWDDAGNQIHSKVSHSQALKKALRANASESLRDTQRQQEKLEAAAEHMGQLNATKPMGAWPETMQDVRRSFPAPAQVPEAVLLTWLLRQGVSPARAREIVAGKAAKPPSPLGLVNVGNKASLSQMAMQKSAGPMKLMRKDGQPTYGDGAGAVVPFDTVVTSSEKKAGVVVLLGAALAAIAWKFWR